MKLIPIFVLTILLALPIGTHVNARPITNPKEMNITHAYEKAKNFHRDDMFNTTTEILTSLLESYGDIDAPKICDIQMPKRMWWLTLVAAECTGADPLFVACVLRFESDFRVGPIGRGTYVGPGGLKYTFRKKFPIDDLFGNILTTARRLAMFKHKNMHAALAGYNKDRSPNYRKYCNSVVGWTNKLHRQGYKKLDVNPSFDAAVVLGRQYLNHLELQVLAFERSH